MWQVSATAKITDEQAKVLAMESKHMAKKDQGDSRNKNT